MKTTMPEKVVPKIGDVYRSNNGDGPLMARILEVTSTDVLMERWKEGGTERVRYRLSLKTMHSRSCGWVLIEGWPTSTIELNELIHKYKSGEFFGAYEQVRLIDMLIAERKNR